LKGKGTTSPGGTWPSQPPPVTGRRPRLFFDRLGLGVFLVLVKSKMKLGRRSEMALVTLNLRMCNCNMSLQVDFEWGRIRAKFALQRGGFMFGLYMIPQS